ncbi:MAG: hypothetical protein H0W96_05755, partial [Solirubrobacterales bacterium]|nr:hypothetical protein [Solirubrobacterales bacterium]
AHVVLLDPPAGPLRAYGAMTHLAWGPAELQFAARVHAWQYDLRAQLSETYRALRAAGNAGGAELESLLRGSPDAPRPAHLAGRLVRVLDELALVSIDRDARILVVEQAERTQLDQSSAFRAYHQRYEVGRRWLSGQTAKAA